MQRIFYGLTALFFMAIVSACGNSHTHAEEEAHEHGPDTHTHGEAVASDTAGTYVDSTSVFFGDEAPEGEGEAEDVHEHGPDTHTHDEDHN